MSYSQYPNEMQIAIEVKEDVSSDSQVITHKVTATCQAAPPKVETWLLTVGWVLAVQDPSTYEQLYTKQDEPAADYMYYRWYEAVAYENWKFMTLADGQNET